MFGAPRGIRTRNRQIRSLVLCVDLVGSSRIWPAQVGRVVDLDGSRRLPSDRLDDQTDDQVPSDQNRIALAWSVGPGGRIRRRGTPVTICAPDLVLMCLANAATAATCSESADRHSPFGAGAWQMREHQGP